MKYDKGSVLDKIISKFPARYVLYILVIWFALVCVLFYLGVK